MIVVAAIAAYMAIWRVPQTALNAHGIFEVSLVALMLGLAFVLPVFVAIARTRELYLVLLDIVAIALFPFALMRLMGPSFDHLSHGSLEATLLLSASCALAYWALVGNMMDRFTMKPGPVNNFTFRVGVSPQRAWQALVPRPGNEVGFIFEGTRFVVDQDASVFEDGTPREMTFCFDNQDWAMHSVFQVDVTEVIEGRYFRAEFAPLDAQGILEMTKGWYAVTVAPQSDGTCALQVEMQVESCPLKWRINWFLSDAHESFAELVKKNICQGIEHFADPEPILGLKATA